jgi:hypothetical protein
MEDVTMASGCTTRRHVRPQARMTPTLKISKRKRKNFPKMLQLEKGLSANTNTAPKPKIYQRRKTTLLEYLENIPQFERQDSMLPLHKTGQLNI